MAKIVTLQEAELISLKVKKQKKRIVLAGGCFDILHIGHIKFLEEAKKAGDVLIVLLENDRKVKQLKGKNRPIFTQQERAYMLSSLKQIDYVVLLPIISTNSKYSDLIILLKPDIIAATANDPILETKKKQVKIVGGRLKIIPCLKTYSSSKLATIIGID